MQATVKKLYNSLRSSSPACSLPPFCFHLPTYKHIKACKERPWGVVASSQNLQELFGTRTHAFSWKSRPWVCSPSPRSTIPVPSPVSGCTARLWWLTNRPAPDLQQISKSKRGAAPMVQHFTWWAGHRTFTLLHSGFPALQWVMSQLAALVVNSITRWEGCFGFFHFLCMKALKNHYMDGSPSVVHPRAAPGNRLQRAENETHNINFLKKISGFSSFIRVCGR